MEIQRAAAVVHKARKERTIHPHGNFDKAGRFYPSPTEDADDYASGIRPPSGKWRYSLMKSARTRKHVVGLAIHAPAFVLSEAAKVASTTKVSHKVVASIGKMIEEARHEHEQIEAARARLVRKRQDEADEAQRLRDEAAADAQHAADMDRDGDILSNLD